METIGQRIRERRLEIGMTQQVIADAFDIARVSVTQWEHDISAPRRDKIVKLAKILDCSPAWLLQGRGGQRKAINRVRENIVRMKRSIPEEPVRSAPEMVVEIDVPGSFSVLINGERFFVSKLVVSLKS